MARHRHRQPSAGPYVHAGSVHVRGIRHGERWTVTVDDDETPISEHRTRVEAETAARAHALTFGYKRMTVHELDGELREVELLDPTPQPPYPGPVKGAPAG